MKLHSIMRALAAPSLLSVCAAQQPAEPPNETVLLPKWTVTDSKPVGYGTTNALGATRMNLPIKDTPQSVVILNRELMDDIGALDGLDILKFASGVSPASTRTINVVTMRGEEVRPNNGANFVDGLPGGIATEIETEFLDRIEFVKGPAGTLYGSHSLGGVINRVFKRPANRQLTVLKATFDSIGSTRQGSLDTTGPAASSGLAYRVIGVWRDGATANGAVDSKEAICGLLSFAPARSAGRLWTRYGFQRIESGHESPNWFYDGAREPSSFLGRGFLSVPAASYAKRKNHSAEAGLETALRGASSTWNARIVARYDVQRNHEYAIIPLGYSFYNAAGALIGTTGTAVTATQPRFSDPAWRDIRLAGSTARRAGDPGKRGNKQFGGYMDIVGDFQTGPASHMLLAYAQLSGERGATGSTGYSLPPGFSFSVINPVYQEIRSLLVNPVVTARNSSSSNAFNFGLQDNLYLLNGRLILAGGARYDFVQDNGTLNELTRVRAPSRTVNNWVFKTGAVFKPFRDNDGVALFYNYSETFTPQTGTNLSGVPFKDLEGKANEIGIKLELLKRGIVVTASVFENELTNFPIRIFNPSLGLDDFFQIGTGTAKGWEADIAWQSTPQLSFLLALSDVDSKNPNGLRKRNVQNGFNYRAVAKYQFAGGFLNRLAVGLAVVSLADRAGDNGNTFVTRGYETIDAFASYGAGRWRVQCNLNNLFNEDGVESSILASLAQTQRPRSARLSLIYTY